MSENIGEVIAGGATLAVAIGFLVFAGQGSGMAPSSDSYDLTASFRSVEGISLGTDVRMAGIKIGSVSALDLNPETFRAEITMSIGAPVAIPEDSSVAVSSEGLLGGNFVELVPGGSPFVLADGEEIVDTQGALSLLGLLAKFVSSSGDE
ncbi:outer membrane lipid asymmetry maintenance protein MlaD [Tropicimonas sp. IMCC6043]|uniref:outer membrane lipid asymmetry maintenance protein MlaD n=1 Tax=Tropicimonas sp. IMCC6043 TaxID=2510645 RepID=UPI00101C81DD|nr:outer membrane lipid asymmetry maintenance protein MlaD [Tropicimonas sp. IMCC6043]RYH11109.1 outer membrane lipid asymmetry maintenance protein MlaD [Tropicimonas sp. IMCC6043]